MMYYAQSPMHHVLLFHCIESHRNTVHKKRTKSQLVIQHFDSVDWKRV